MHRTNRRLTILSVIAIAAAIEGCGGGSSTPSPAPTGRSSSPATGGPEPSPTAIEGGATATIRFVSGLSSAAKAVAVRFPNAPVATATLTAGCGATATCAVTVPAPIGPQTFQVDAYASTSATETPLGIAEPSATFLAAANTALNVRIEGLMASYALSLPSPGLTAQIAGSQPIVVSPKDAAGVPIASPFLTNAGQPAQFDFVQTATDGTTTTLPTAAVRYSGLAPNPSELTASIGGYPNVSIPIPVAPATGTVGYALQTGTFYKDVGGDTPTYGLGTGSSTVIREYDVYGDDLAFDPNGTLWVAGGPQNAPIQGIGPSGSSVGPITSVTPGSRLLGFDTSGRLYTVTGDKTSIDVYTIGAGYAGTLVRNIVPPGGSCRYGAADRSQNLYVACAAGVSEFGPNGGNGSVPPATTNTIATGPVAVDRAGDVYASYCAAPNPCVLGIWPHGTFGSGAPPASLPEPNDATDDYRLASVAVDPDGNVYELSNYVPLPSQTAILWFIPNGSTTPQVLQSQGFTSAVATPLQ